MLARSFDLQESIVRVPGRSVPRRRLPWGSSVRLVPVGGIHRAAGRVVRRWSAPERAPDGPDIPWRPVPTEAKRR